MRIWMTESLEDIINKQFELSKHTSISISESNRLADWERDAYVNILLKKLKEEVNFEGLS
jgi:hypothetical protein